MNMFPPNKLPEAHVGTGWLTRLLAPVINEIARWCNRLQAGPGLIFVASADGNCIQIDPEAGGLSVPVQITGAKSGNYYTGSVFGDGPTATATETGQKIRIHGFDVDLADTQGFYAAIPGLEDVGASTYETVWQVFPGHPTPPSSGGLWVMIYDASTGLMQWVEVVDCDGDPV